MCVSRTPSSSPMKNCLTWEASETTGIVGDEQGMEWAGVYVAKDSGRNLFRLCVCDVQDSFFQNSESLYPLYSPLVWTEQVWVMF